MSEASVHRLPVTMRTVFQDLLLVTYEVAPQRLAELLPPVIHPYVRDGRSYVSIVVGNLRGMRPAPLPEFLGVNYYQIVYRAVVRLRRADGTELPGVFFLRWDGNDPLMSLFGNRLSEFRFHFFHTGALSLYRRRDELLVAAETSDGAGDLVLHARDLGPAEARPCAPGFLDVDDEKRTLVQLFHAYAHDAPRGCATTWPSSAASGRCAGSSCSITSPPSSASGRSITRPQDRSRPCTSRSARTCGSRWLRLMRGF